MFEKLNPSKFQECIEEKFTIWLWTAKQVLWRILNRFQCFNMRNIYIKKLALLMHLNLMHQYNTVYEEKIQCNPSKFQKCIEEKFPF